MTAQELLPQLQSGDIMLYKPSNVFGLIIAIKTWTWISHCEVFLAPGVSVAARDGVGVNRYANRTADLCEVRRPLGKLDLSAASKWFETVKGEPYDWAGLLVFTLAVRHGAKNKQFCSKFATSWYRAAGIKPVSDETLPEEVPPAGFRWSPAYSTIWTSNPSKPVELLWASRFAIPRRFRKLFV